MQMRTTLAAAALLASGALLGWLATPSQLTPAVQAEEKRTTQKPPAGFPALDEVQRLYDEADLNRAIEAYKFFYPTVSINGTWKGNLDLGIVPNKVFAVLEGNPKQLVFTANSDTPYAGILLDLTAGPFIVDLPPGPFMCVVNDMNQRFVMDLGLPGPDKGKGGKHLIRPPGYKDKTPEDYFAGTATTNRVLLMLRVIPPKGDSNTAIEMMKTAKVYPLNPPADWAEPKWVSVSDQVADLTPLKWENNLKYWELLQEVIDKEPPYEPYRGYYGELAALGISKGKVFAPDARMKGILEKAAKTANTQMRAQSFADRRPDRVVWKNRKWEWATLRPENGTFDTPSYKDLEAREKWFFQAQIESPAMFRRTAEAGSLYWLGVRDGIDAYLDGGKAYKLTVPQPVPAKLFWSVTVYDTETRSQIQTETNKAALRSLFELKDTAGEKSVNLYFGPEAPEGNQGQWIKTIPGKGWFAYFRIYGPDKAAFDGTWKLGDFQEVK